MKTINIIIYMYIKKLLHDIKNLILLAGKKKLLTNLKDYTLHRHTVYIYPVKWTENFWHNWTLNK